MKKIGFIGVGIMGRSMVRNLMKHGYELHIYARHPQKVTDVVAEGAHFHDTITSCVKASEAVITMVGYPSDVEEVYLGENGIFAAAANGTLLIDMTTSSPRLAKMLYAHGKARSLAVLDAPVTGGDSGAKAGTLTILVGGEKAAYEQAYPLFQAMGTHIYYCGEAGRGQHMKLANQIMIAGTLSGVSEAIAYAKQQGMDPSMVISYLKDGAAGSRQLELLGPKMVAEDYAPGFFIKHFIKDMTLADGEARARDLPMPVLEKVLAMFRALEAQGYGDEGTQALIRAYRC